MMNIALIILLIVLGIHMLLYIIWKRGDWYLFLFIILVSIGICVILTLISDILSIGFAILVAIYSIYNLINKKARRISYEIKQQIESIHEEYKQEEVDNQITFKNYVLPSGNKIDYINFQTKTFYLLRPYTQDIEKRYNKQIKKYMKELEEVYDGEWSYVIDTY